MCALEKEISLEKRTEAAGVKGGAAVDPEDAGLRPGRGVPGSGENFAVPLVLMTLGWDPYGDPTHRENASGRDTACALRVLEMSRVVGWFTSHTRKSSRSHPKVIFAVCSNDACRNWEPGFRRKLVGDGDGGWGRGGGRGGGLPFLYTPLSKVLRTNLETTCAQVCTVRLCVNQRVYVLFLSWQKNALGSCCRALRGDGKKWGRLLPLSLPCLLCPPPPPHSFPSRCHPVLSSD